MREEELWLCRRSGKCYRLVGNSKLRCLDGGWDGRLPECEEVQCEEPDIQNAEWHEGSRPPYGYKAMVTFRCRSGYVMGGADTQKCEINGQWSPGLPACEHKSKEN